MNRYQLFFDSPTVLTDTPVETLPSKSRATWHGVLLAKREDRIVALFDVDDDYRLLRKFTPSCINGYNLDVLRRCADVEEAQFLAAAISDQLVRFLDAMDSLTAAYQALQRDNRMMEAAIVHEQQAAVARAFAATFASPASAEDGLAQAAD